MARTIPLNHGFMTVIDDDYEWLNQWKWFCDSQGYANRNLRKSEGYGSIRMHVQIMQPPKGITVDHKNLDKLDNQRPNLRLATPVQQIANRQKLHRSGRIPSSQYKGVYWEKNRQKWNVFIAHQSLGRFDLEEEAALAYDRAAIIMFGEFALINFPAATH